VACDAQSQGAQFIIKLSVSNKKTACVNPSLHARTVVVCVHGRFDDRVVSGIVIYVSQF